MFNSCASPGYTHLTYAINQCQVDMVLELVSKGANVNETCNYGWAPIHLALTKTDNKIATFIIEHPSFNPNVKRIGGGETPLMYAILYERRALAQKLFKREDIDLTLKDADGNTYETYLKYRSLNPSWLCSNLK